MFEVSKEQQKLVMRASRALARGGLVHAFGHCSIRLNDDYFLVSAPKALGYIGAGDPGAVVPIRGELPDGVLAEVRIHQSAYAQRADVNAVCRVTPPNVELLSLMGLTPRPRHGLSAIFHPQIPLWNDVRLLRDAKTADQLVAALGGSNAIVMRANGAVIVGRTAMDTVATAWLLEDAARVEVSLRQMNADMSSTLLSPDEIGLRQATAEKAYGRIWDYLTAPDEGVCL